MIEPEAAPEDVDGDDRIMLPEPKSELEPLVISTGPATPPASVLPDDKYNGPPLPEPLVPTAMLTDPADPAVE
jgi:hypothetical protein